MPEVGSKPESGGREEDGNLLFVEEAAQAPETQYQIVPILTPGAVEKFLSLDDLFKCIVTSV